MGSNSRDSENCYGWIDESASESLQTKAAASPSTASCCRQLYIYLWPQCGRSHWLGYTSQWQAALPPHCQPSAAGCRCGRRRLQPAAVAAKDLTAVAPASPSTASCYKEDTTRPWTHRPIRGEHSGRQTLQTRHSFLIFPTWFLRFYRGSLQTV